MMLAILIYNFLFFGAVTVFKTFIPLFFKYKGLSTTEIGLLMAAGSLIGILSQPFWGYLSDKKKSIKRVLIFALVAALFTSTGLFTLVSFYPLLLFVFLFMFFFTPTGPLTEGLNITFAKSNGKNYGGIRLWGSLGAATMTYFFGVLIDKWGIQYLYFIWLPIFVLTIVSICKIKNSARKAPPITHEGLIKLLKKPLFLWFLCIVLLIAIPHRMNDSLLGLYMVELGATESQVGWAWTISFLSEIPAFAFIVIILRKYNELTIISIAAVFYALRWIIFSIVDQPWIIVLLQVSNSITFGLFYFSSIQFLIRIVPEEMRTIGMVSFGVVFGGIAGVIGSSAGGWIMDYFSPQAAYLAGGVLAIVGALATVVTHIYLQRKTRLTFPASPDL